MKFEEALKCMREGKTVTRKPFIDYWETPYWKIENNEIVGGCFRDNGWEEENLDEYDILQDDWVIYDEQKFKEIIHD